MEPTRLKTDIAIIGGGIAGLWLLNLLRDRGYSVLLVEREALGSGQTIASQGMIHGGIKYTLAGQLTGASETIANMPARWRDCHSGNGDIDLRGVKTLSEDYYMFSDGRLSSKITTFFGSKAIEGRVSAVEAADLPPVFQDKAFAGLVYKLSDIVLDTRSLLDHLATRYPESVIQSQSTLLVRDGGLRGIVLEDGSAIEAGQTILAAGQGNGAMIEQLDLPVTMQLRPLNQVVVKGDLPALYAHAVSLKSADKPRLTITTHPAGSGNAWYLGGQLAETGVDRSDRAQVSFARRELSSLFPWLDFDACEFSTHRVSRAEPGNSEGQRPDTPFVRCFDNVIVCWPTKLTLAPLMGDMVLEALGEVEPGVPMPGINGPQPGIAAAPWEQAT